MGFKAILLSDAFSMSGWWLNPTPLKNDGVRQWEG
jgi:hypothetical protein